ncbi:MAG: DNA polymerase III subunit alpha [Alphaproteobacteria bacterium]|jgi:DNA polymerase-3 subunit alpha|nr:DNA polymerase III subunit alpha [Alphaproteobacteria bacterium]
MAHADFVHLRVHSAYSLLEGAIRIEELVGLCSKAAMPAVAISDSANLFGQLEFAMAAGEAGVQPIPAMILPVERPDADPVAAARGGAKPRPDRLLLIAQDRTGYENLMALISDAYLETEAGDDAHVGWAAFEGRTEGVICLTGGPEGPVGRLLADGQAELAGRVLSTLERLFPGRLYVELMRHGLAVEDRIEPALIDLAYDRDLPLVATNDCYFPTADMYEAHDALLCIADGTYVIQDDRRRVTPEHRFKSAAEMRALFEDLPEAVDNTLTIARRCSYLVDKHPPILPAFATAGGRSEVEELRAQAHDGLERRLETHVYGAEMDAAERERRAGPYRERLDYELSVIEKMGFPGYFLIVSDFIKWAKGQGIPVGPGRGSGAGSVVAWALTITDLDPMRFGLLFERFLNPERVSMPDFDVDFCQDRRDEVIEYVRDKYGHDKVAQIITFGTLQARAALRDVGRVLQLPYPEVDRICKLVPNNPAKPTTLQQAIDGEPQLRDARRADARVGRMIDIALKIEGLYRHASTHAAGVVIGDRPLAELVPLYRDPRSPMPVTQFNMKFVEKAGLVKFDFLGLKTLTVLARAVELIRRPKDGGAGTPIDLETIPLDDPATYEMLSAGVTTGVFQLESSGMRDVLRQLKPNRFEDIIALVALYRPGPMDNIPTYIAVKNGQQKPDYLYPSLQPILEETFGIMIYQEQVMQVAQELAGYTLGAADLLRRAMGKKIKAEMEAQKKVFVEGAVGRGVDQAQASRIFDQVEKFAGYGFNKSHAAAYALVAYQTAFLKANYPVAFFAASMTLDYGNTDKLNTFKQELDRLGIKLLTPDINRSEALFSVEHVAGEDYAIRYALGAIKGVGVDAMHAVVAEREANGPFKSVFDFARRIDSRAINKRQLENLVRAGAFDPLNPNRAQMLAGVDMLVRYAQASSSEREQGQSSLFGGGEQSIDQPKLPAVPDWEAMEKLRQEFDAIGFYLSAHPLDGANTRRLTARSWAEVQTKYSGQTVKMAGIVMAKRESKTKTDKRMAFVQLSDTTGVYEVTLFEEVLSVARPLLNPGQAVVMTVEVQPREDSVRLTASSVDDLDRAIARAGVEVRVFLDSERAVAPLHDRLEREGRGKGTVKLLVPVGDGREAEIVLSQGYAVSQAGRAALKEIPGVAAVELI